MTRGQGRLSTCAALCLWLAVSPTAPADEIQVPVQAGPDPAAGSEQLREPMVRETFGSSDIKDWYAPEEQTVIIRTYAHGTFRGTLTNSCSGIRYTDSLGFSTQGPFELDRSTMIVLPHGVRCFFKDLSGYSDEDEQRDRAAARARPANSSRPIRK